MYDNKKLKGQWIYEMPYSEMPDSYNLTLHTFHCSCCGGSVLTHIFIGSLSFCPWCGATMAVNPVSHNELPVPEKLGCLEWLSRNDVPAVNTRLRIMGKQSDLGYSVLDIVASRGGF